MAATIRTESNGEEVTAIAICEVRNRTERADFDQLAGRVGRHGRMRLLADGPITAYLIRLPLAAAPLFSGLAVSLRNDFVFGQVVTPVQETVLTELQRLSEETNGAYFPVETCALCGKETLFTTRAMVRGEDGKRRESDAVYCEACAVSIADAPVTPIAVSAPADAAVLAA